MKKEESRALKAPMRLTIGLKDGKSVVGNILQFCGALRTNTEQGTLWSCINFTTQQQYHKNNSRVSNVIF